MVVYPLLIPLKIHDSAIFSVVDFPLYKLPHTSLMNGADSMLLAARNDFIRAEQIRSRKWIKLLIFSLIVLSGIVWFVLTIGPWLSTYPFLFLYFLIMAVGGIFIFLSTLLALILTKDIIRRRKGISKIMSAPKKAPADRWLEYEIRMLLMLNNFMNPQEQIRRIQRIREKSQSDLYNPWLSKLKELKYYNLSLVKQRRLPVKLIIVCVFISPYLLLLLASLISDLFNL